MERKLLKLNQSGQALVLVLLSLSVVLTVVLFILSRSITDISSSTKQSDSVRAFSAAEAGIERALITGAGQTGDLSGATYSVTVAETGEISSFSNPVPMASGDTSTLWFVAHNDTGGLTCSVTKPCFTGNTLNFCWGNAGTSSSLSTTPAIEVSFYYKVTPGDLTDFSDVQIARAVLDPNTTRRSSNYFSAPDSGTCTIGTTTYAFQKAVTLSSLGVTTYGTQGGLLFAKVRMIYNTDTSHFWGANADYVGNSLLPSQGKSYVSTGVSGAEGTVSNRRISVFTGWGEFPFSGLAVFSPIGITK